MYQSEPHKWEHPKGYADLFLLPVVSENCFMSWELLRYKAPVTACSPGLCFLCWQPIPALDTCSGGSLWSHHNVVSLAQHKSTLPLKPSAFSSCLLSLVRSSSWRQAAWMQNRTWTSFTYHFPSHVLTHTQPDSATGAMHGRRDQEDYLSPWQCKLCWTDVATEQKPEYKDFMNTPICQTQGRFICLVCMGFWVWSSNVHCWLKVSDTRFTLTGAVW